MSARLLPRPPAASIGAFALMTAAACGGSRPPPPPPPRGPAVYFLSIEHQNRMGESFRPIGIAASLDGEPVFAAQAPDGEQLPDRMCIHRARVAAGAHAVRVQLTYRGHGRGVFSYLSGYRFRTDSTHELEMPSNAFGLHLRTWGYEAGGATAPLEERPQVGFEPRVERSDPNAGCHAEPSGGLGPESAAVPRGPTSPALDATPNREP